MARGVALLAAADVAATSVLSEKVVTASMLDAIIERIASTALAPTLLGNAAGRMGPIQMAAKAVAMATRQ